MKAARREGAYVAWMDRSVRCDRVIAAEQPNLAATWTAKLCPEGVRPPSLCAVFGPVVKHATVCTRLGGIVVVVGDAFKDPRHHH